MLIAKYALLLMTNLLAFAGAWLFTFTEKDAPTGRQRLTKPGKIALPIAVILLVAAFTITILDDRRKAANTADAAEAAKKREAELSSQLSGVKELSEKTYRMFGLSLQPQTAARDAQIAALMDDPTLREAAQLDPRLGGGSIGDEKVRWAEFKYFRDQFICPECGRKRFKRPLAVNKPICSAEKCEAQFAFSGQTAPSSEVA